MFARKHLTTTAATAAAHCACILHLWLSGFVLVVLVIITAVVFVVVVVVDIVAENTH